MDKSDPKYSLQVVGVALKMASASMDATKECGVEKSNMMVVILQAVCTNILALIQNIYEPEGWDIAVDQIASLLKKRLNEKAPSQ